MNLKIRIEETLAARSFGELPPPAEMYKLVREMWEYIKVLEEQIAWLKHEASL